ncbi:hypothetical protein DS832_07305 [Bombilactobacillus bombi]|uniref:Uncharacterized protein n=1 Tax=Bombilactobacillus bombi TaxID=1303590 RepID=A0A3R6UUK1_9LACO|nr:hypothetical protein [Bombilactobacillus bombi]RHW45621.1 hypothetical protein DS832_07305 [Bombilactobacillus bombi]
MTKFTQTLKATVQSRIKMVTRLLVLNVAVIAVSFIFTMFFGEARKYWSLSLVINVLLWLVIFAIAILIKIAWTSRNDLRSNRFRLIPVSETKLYLADNLSSLISFIYAHIMQAIFIIISLGIMWFTLPSDSFSASFKAGFQYNNISAGDIGSDVLSLLSPILLILLVHLVDFISTVILNYIPGGAQKFIKVIIYIIVIALTIYIIFNLGKVLVSFYTGTLAQESGAIWLTNGIVGGFIIVIGAINIYLLRNVETIR